MLPLSGIRVVEFGQVAAGPFCGMLLADMGADVIKVESPEGDGLRAWPPHTKNPAAPDAPGFSENFASVNRNKRSVVLDLRDAPARAAARRLALSADVVLENFRPGVLAKLGLGYEALAKEKPALVYCSISAFGQAGPRAQEGGFDLTIQAIGGVMSVTGEPGGRPVKCGVPLSDFSAGLYAAFAIVSALRKAGRDGLGQHIDVAMLGATLGIAALQTSEYFGTGRDPVKLGSAHPRNAPYQAFRAGDGDFAMAAGNDRLWLAVCDALGRADLAADPRFATTALRAKNQEALRDLLEAEFAGRTVADLLSLFAARGVPCAPINTYSQVLADPQVADMGWVRPLELPNGAHTLTFVSPLRMSRETFGVYRRPPALGEHTAEVLAELGLAPEAGREADA
ncbi:MAG: CoA transferase [Burkholderiales bacterium]|nr:CoA transferase [Burkholderiales bacterium]